MPILHHKACLPGNTWLAVARQTRYVYNSGSKWTAIGQLKENMCSFWKEMQFCVTIEAVLFNYKQNQQPVKLLFMMCHPPDSAQMTFC